MSQSTIERLTVDAVVWVVIAERTHIAEETVTHEASLCVLTVSAILARVRHVTLVDVIVAVTACTQIVYHVIMIATELNICMYLLGHMGYCL